MDLTNLVENRTHISENDLIDILGNVNSSPKGLKIGKIEENLNTFGSNVLPKRKSDGFFKLLQAGFQDRIIQILSIASIISLGTGLYEYFVYHVDLAYVEGLAIIVTIFLVLFINAYQDYQKERQFEFLSSQNDSNLKATVFRIHCDGDVENNRQSIQASHIPVSELVVGDVIKIQNGDVIPADCIILTYSSLKLDESSVTGESDHVEKDEEDRYLISGSKVVDGLGTALVLAVGIHSQNGKLLMSLVNSSEFTPLQVKLNLFGEKIAKYGTLIAGLILCISIGKYLYKGIADDSIVVFQKFVHFVISAITVIVVAVPEGLPMAVTLSLSFATIQMMKDNNLVRVLASCETMGNATTICSDKTGTLTQNIMTVVKCCLNLKVLDPDTHLKDQLDAETLELICKTLNINSTASEMENEEGLITFLGSKTEVALLNFTRNVLGSDYVFDRKHATILKIIPFASDRKRMCSIVRLENNSLRFYVKGAAEIILSLSTTFLSNGEIELMNEENYKRHMKIIDNFASLGLRTIAFGFKRVEEDQENDDKSLTLIGIVGIEDPVRPEVPDAVKSCQNAGITVRMVTGDNLKTAKSIALKANILNPLATAELSMEGSEFRELSHEKRLKILPTLRVLARSSPLDKQILVKTLKSMGEIVAVTGDGTNDGPALKEANVGFSMGIAGTEVAKMASDIILLDDNFSSLVKAVIWGRSIFDSIRKFLQFQLTVNIVAVALAVVSVILDEDSEPILTAVQLLWVNLIMDTFAALALATDRPDPTLLKRKPYKSEEPLISPSMWTMIIVQAVYQFLISFILMKYPHLIMGEYFDELTTRSFVFNVFVFLQIFNLLNARRIEGQLNIFKNIHKNPFFIPLFLFIIGLQIALIEVSFFHVIFKTTNLSPKQWLVSIGAGVVSLLVALLTKVTNLPRKSK
eukprot:NODE_40_length_35084_cov_0.543519.p3 type:complete len:923 gc:universal NODE_40_length_35084_cov_0.543519:31963-29195(-)